MWFAPVSGRTIIPDESDEGGFEIWPTYERATALDTLNHPFAFKEIECSPHRPVGEVVLCRKFSLGRDGFARSPNVSRNICCDSVAQT